MPRRESRLAQETSPYLLQHVNNPVDWYTWGPEALARAQEENKPILLSIGYSSCHYCHVMERESFRNEATAKLMNSSFVCIKVDREERPDIDDVYMKATVAMNGSGGWPMTVFLTPEGTPFFAGTYFPPEDQEGRIGFPRLLTQLAELWKTKREDLTNQSAELSRHVRGQFENTPAGSLSEESMRVAARRLAQEFDSSFGGFGGAPKFPPAPALDLLLRYHLVPGQQNSLDMVTRTLDGMMTGGLFDQLGGGFFRYSVDQKWLVPHFEKMLYDNAELVKIYIQAFQATGHDPYRRVACESLDFVLREMQSPQGGFFSSMDADSENQEGAYYLWTRDQVSQVLQGKSITAFCEFYGVQEEGPLAGASVLTTRRSFSNVAKELGLPEDELVSSLETARTKMLEARAQRVAPAVDDKVLASYNGLFISALVDGARAFGDARYLEAAVRAAEFILAPGEDGSGLRRADGGLLRSARAGRSHINGFLDDYAFVAEALLKLYEIGAGLRYLGASRELCDRMLKDFWDNENGAFFSTSSSHEQLFARGRDAHDGAMPHPNAVACRTLTRLAVHTGDNEYREYAIQIAQAFAGSIKRSPRAHCGLLAAVDSLLQAPLEVVLSGSPDSENWKELAAVLGSQYLPYRVEARVTRSSDLGEPAALTQGRFTEGAEPQVFLCRDHVCSSPLSTPETLASQLEQQELELRQLRRRELGSQRLSGRASPEATAARAQASSLVESAYTTLQKLTISKVGLGGYRIGLDQPKHREAVRHALLSGINLVDSSPTFALGDSERLIGQVLNELSADEKLKREEIVLISKVGVAQGSEAETLEARRQQAELPFTVALKTSGQDSSDLNDSLHAGAFSLDPEFMRAQIRGSLERLGVEHLDVCLIQSPEHLLASGHSQEQMGTAIAQAFTTLEAEVEAGRIGCYGILTNTAALPAEEPMHVDLSGLLQSADQTPHFKVLALPINVVETACLEPASGQSESVVQRATNAGLSVLACRPLSAMIGGALLRLAEPPVSEDGGSADALSASRYKVASLEAEFETTLAAQLRLAKRAGQEAILPLSGALGQAVEQVKTRQQFELAEATLLTPRLRHLLGQLDRAFAGPGEQSWAKFRDRYIQAIGAWLANVREKASNENRRLLRDLEANLTQRTVFSTRQKELLQADSTWATKAVLALLEEPRLASVLVGLRKKEQVDEILAPLQKP